ncbi:chitosanase [Leptolyngbya sp. 7M]|uniref:chitosanase n=1 Tax=Leptolyngbya sp. 7M TaxID=2812896 RepID=UPI001B8A9D5F|nr:chitosanase [Leptolyngbya sp. 7M]QYO65518.1 chitosanase [Leptolyngbya sp. 7M]
MIERYEKLSDRSPKGVLALSSDRIFKNALRAAGMTREMRDAQDRVAIERYLNPAIAACAAAGFHLPLSLVVIYDSLTHGSYQKIRDLVSIRGGDLSPTEFEKQWVTEYVRVRDRWLSSIPRLRPTRYRTRFFLDQIMLGRWQLELPMNVNRVLLTNKLLGIDVIDTRSIGFSLSFPSTSSPQYPHDPASLPAFAAATASMSRQAEACAPVHPNSGSLLDEIETRVSNAAKTFDRIERTANAVIDRTDRAKSLWTAIVGTVFQSAWAVFGFLFGLPREVWFFAAGIAAALTLMYLYRQISLGRIRECFAGGTGKSFATTPFQN